MNRDNASPKTWPASPYKGLSFYGVHDSPLFAARDSDIEHCARLVAHPSTRLMILHGLTGCGKSSFLRAGLIPLLEKSSSGFRFLHEVPKAETTSQAGSKALFIRCTSEPLETVATSLCHFIREGMTVQTPVGTKTVNLRKALSPGTDDDRCVATLGDDSTELLRVLESLSSIVPQTLTLVIDQAEEVLTLDQGVAGEEARRAFFDFLGLFTRTTFDLKLVLALRTEYYGRIYAKLRQAQADLLGVREFFLDELTQEQLVQAIEHPTSDVSIPGLGSPREFYKFTYEKGVAQKIVEQLSETVVAGGTLPVLQIVCSTLWERARQGKSTPFQVTSKDYDALGGLAGQVEEHLDRVLVNWAKTKPMRTDQAFREAERWKRVLHRLARTQADGSVTTEIVKQTDLVVDAEKRRCVMEPSSTLRYLATDPVRVLREVYVVNRKTRENTMCYSLGHDTLGLVLRRWKLLRDDAEFNIHKLRRRTAITGVALLVIAGVGGVLIRNGFLKFLISPDSWDLVGVPALYGFLAILVSIFTRANSIPSPLTVRMLRVMLRVYPPFFAQRLLSGENKTLFRAYPDLRTLCIERASRQPNFLDKIMTLFTKPFIDLVNVLVKLARSMDYNQ
jgi:hypothetical protein